MTHVTNAACSHPSVTNVVTEISWLFQFLPVPYECVSAGMHNQITTVYALSDVSECAHSHTEIPLCLTLGSLGMRSKTKNMERWPCYLYSMPFLYQK